MEAMRNSWTDDRLDDLNTRIDQGFSRVEAEIRGVRTEMRTEFAAIRGETEEESSSVRADMKEEFASVRQEMKEGFALMEKRFERMDERFDGFQQTINRFGAGIIIALLGVLLTQI
jgi:hypothetical protein